MAITIPWVVLAGLLAFAFNFRVKYSSTQKLKFALLLLTIFFPLVFVIIKSSNLYGAWRHFLFVYPGLVLISALGIQLIFTHFKSRIIRLITIVVLLGLSVHPFRFMAANHPYYYLYFNQFVGGLNGAYGNFETDYYYHSMQEAADWLKEHIKKNPDSVKVRIGGNFPIQWQFRHESSIQFVYFPYVSRSFYDWDYAIVANSYIPAVQLKNKVWPPENTIHTVMADGIPICAVIKRSTKDDFMGIVELKNRNYINSALLFEKALKIDRQNEMICYKFAESLIGQNQVARAEEVLKKGLEINPEFELAWELLGDLAKRKNDTDNACKFYENSIAANRKYCNVYPKLAAIYAETNVDRARSLLHKCLKINRRFLPALELLAKLYRETAPEKAAFYDRMINKLK
jgi:tetratricopeptide (TPR) repeat protein